MKKNRSLLIIAISILFAGCPASKSSTDAVQLKLNLEKGKTYTYGMKTHMDMNMEMMGQKMNTGFDMDFRYLIVLEKVDSQGNNIIKSTIGDLKVKAEVMGMSMGYDSKEKVDTSHQDAMSASFRKMFGGMVGKSFKVTLAPNGEVKEVEGVNELVTSMADAMPGSDEEKTKMKDQLSQSFNEQLIKQSYGQMFNLYPDKPVKVGDTWNKEVEFAMKGMNNKQEITYKVKEITADNVVLDLKGDIKTSGSTPSDSTTKAPAMSMTGTETGTMTLDRTSGMTTSGDIDMILKGMVEVQGKKMPMDMKMKVTLANK